MGKDSTAHQIDPERGDPVIGVVLDELVALTGWDPVSIRPDDNLHRDLELSEGEFLEFTRRLSHHFLADIKMDFENWQGTTLRDVVARIRGLMSQERIA